MDNLETTGIQPEGRERQFLYHVMSKIQGSHDDHYDWNNIARDTKCSNASIAKKVFVKIKNRLHWTISGAPSKRTKANEIEEAFMVHVLHNILITPVVSWSHVAKRAKLASENTAKEYFKQLKIDLGWTVMSERSKRGRDEDEVETNPKPMKMLRGIPTAFEYGETKKIGISTEVDDATRKQQSEETEEDFSLIAYVIDTSSDICGIDGIPPDLEFQRAMESSPEPDDQEGFGT